ncbi:MAG: hypothetical protein MUE47_11070 [Acidobacteria bacterium]|nr:hypothetical protein [Acidobacteriota bacterium]
MPRPLLIAALLASGAGAPLGAFAAEVPAGGPLPPLELAYVCDTTLSVTAVRAMRGETVLAEISVPGCEPAGRALDGSPLVSATVFARLRDRLAALGHARDSRLVARPLGPLDALPESLLPPTLLAAPKEGITVEWCGTVVSLNRDDCLGSCNCGNKDGCPCRATKTTAPKTEVETQSD